jgi:hypothetical protein
MRSGEIARAPRLRFPAPLRHRADGGRYVVGLGRDDERPCLHPQNADADPASAVSWTRLDDDTSIDPNRFVSSIYVDPANGNHAWISYSGFHANTPSTPGHVFEVTYNPGTGTSTWVDRSYDMQDIPVTDLVRDDLTGNLYAANDFGVLLLANGTTSWVEAASGMPAVEIAGLTIVPGERILYAASHGLSAWRLNLD